MRNKVKTKQKLRDAVGRLIVKNGFTGLGVNAVAREAGVDKVLIYRYFGDLNGLISSYLEEKDFFSRQENFETEGISPSGKDELIERTSDIFRNQVSILLNNRELREIMRWELKEEHESLKELAAKRENVAKELLSDAEKYFGKETDFNAITAIMTAGINYLVLRSKTVQEFNGINIRSLKGWKRITEAVDMILSYMVNNSGEEKSVSKNISDK